MSNKTYSNHYIYNMGHDLGVFGHFGFVNLRGAKMATKIAWLLAF